MLAKGEIQPSDSPWSSPIVLVTKKDGSTSFCVDYRKVNTVTRKDAYPLPHVDDTLDTWAGSKLFSTLDLATGYWQVEVADEDKEKTAFSTPENLSQFEVMPFGSCNAPATFQRLMDKVLSGLKWYSCLVYIDDIVVVGDSFENHLYNLVGVLKRLREAGLKVKPSKCSLCQREVQYLGHVLSTEGISTDPTKVEAICNWPTPTCKQEIQRFLGLANFYRRFIKNFSSIAKPLQRLTEKNNVFHWNELCQSAFDELCRCLVSSPVLAYPDYSKCFVLDTDASDVGIGAVLSQPSEDGSDRVIAYASRSLSRQEQRYCVTRRELLAVVEFTHHFRPYLLGRQFTLRTDHMHGSLVWLQNFKEPEGQLARWLERLHEFDFVVIHRQGTQHCNADAFSRIPCRQCGRVDKGKEVEFSASVSVLPAFPFQSYSLEDMQRLQMEDASINPVYQAVRHGQIPPLDVSKTWSRESRLLLQKWQLLCIKNSVLWKRIDDGNDGLQLVLPSKLQASAIRNLHEGAVGGHLGEESLA